MKIWQPFCMIIIIVYLIGIEVRAEVVLDYPNGKNGYYVSAPTIELQREETGEMKYRLKTGNGAIVSGKVEETTLCIPAELLKEGKNTLDIWKEDEKGNVQDGSMSNMFILLDQTAPKCELKLVENRIEITAADNYSGVEKICYFFGENEFLTVNGNRAFVVLPENFVGKLQAYAVDVAGNQGEITCYEKKKKPVQTVIVKPVEKKEEVMQEEIEEENPIEDVEAPNIVLTGIENYLISKEAVSYECIVTDIGEIEKLSGVIHITKDTGEETSYELTEWETIENGYCLKGELEQTGKYLISVLAKDQVGNEKNICMQVIVDQDVPVINGLEQWEGKEIREFQWNHREEEIIDDFTSTTYAVYLDDVVYTTNTVILTPGTHELIVRAKDIAGNITENGVMFTIKQQIDWRYLGRHSGDFASGSEMLVEKKEKIKAL